MANQQAESLSAAAYQHIKQKIVSLEMPPGSVIDRTQLGEELGLGRTPIREALQRLALEKLVTIVPRRGMFVTDIGITDLQRLFEVRLQLEGLAARLAARRGTDAHWQQMADLLAEVPDETIELDNEAWIHIDEAFHQVIYEASENQFLQDILSTLYALSLRLWYFFLPEIGNMRQAILEHEHILEALRQGDGDIAADCIWAHIQAFQQKIQASMLGMSQPDKR